MASFEILEPVLSSESLLVFVVLQAGFFPLLHLSDEEMLPFDLRTVGWKLIQKMTFASWLEAFSDIHNILPPPTNFCVIRHSLLPMLPLSKWGNLGLECSDGLLM